MKHPRRVAVVFGLVLLQMTAHSAAQVSGGPDEAALSKDIEFYARLPSEKAFAIGHNSDGLFTYGYSFAESTVDTARKLALHACYEGAALTRVEVRCEVVFVGASVVSDDPLLKTLGMDASYPSEPTTDPKPQVHSAVSFQEIPADVVSYEEKWVSGVGFQIGASNELQVWISMYKGKNPFALVYVVNGSSHPITFAPESIQANAVKRRRVKKEVRPIKTFSAAEYGKKVRSRQRWAAALYGVAVGLANSPQSQTSTYSGTYRGSGSAGYSYGSYYGTITTWPTASDYAAAGSRSAAQVQAMASHLQQSFQAMASTLMRTHTLEPGTYYGGTVYFQKFAEKALGLTVAFGGREFRFAFEWK